MKERPILFSGPMVRAILDGLKTQTRRVVKPQPEHDPHSFRQEYWVCRNKGLDAGYAHTNADALSRLLEPLCPYGQPGDLLRVRETWAAVDHMEDGYDREDPICIGYRADLSAICHETYNKHSIDVSQWNWNHESIKWRPSIFMPKWTCRLKPPITDVRVERLQDISATDCIAEGIERTDKRISDVTIISRCQRLWDSINAKPKPVYQNKKIVSYVSYPWEDIRETREHRGKPWQIIGNPWVWVISFERTERP